MLLADANSTLYKIVFVVHLVSVIIGFGGVALNGIYGRSALENQGANGAAIARTNTKASAVAAYAMFSVPVWGIFLIILSGKEFTFAQPWVSASFTLYIIGIALGIGVLRPASTRFDAAVADPTRSDEAEKLGKMLAVVSGITNLLWIVIVFLMVFKPGL